MRDVAPGRSKRSTTPTQVRWRPRHSLVASVLAIIALAAMGALTVTLAMPNRAAAPQDFAAEPNSTLPDGADLDRAAQARESPFELAAPAAIARAPLPTPEQEVPLPPEAFTAAVMPIQAVSQAEEAPPISTDATPAPAVTTAASVVATPAAAPTVASTPAAAQSSAPAPAASTPLSVRERGLLDAMNRARVANGLPALSQSAPLLPIARARSGDMVTNQYFSHFAPNGDSVYTLVTAAGLRFSAIGENLARVSGDEARSVAVAIEKLMASPPHRANILSPHFTHVAVGTVTGADGVTVFTSVFSGG